MNTDGVDLTPPTPRLRLGWRERWMAVNMVLFGLTGVVLLYRAVARGGRWPAYLIGLLLLLACGHRFLLFRRFVWKAGDRP